MKRDTTAYAKHIMMVLILVLVLTLPAIGGCDDDDGGTSTVTITRTATATQTATQTATSTPTATSTRDTRPIKIGGIADYSGQGAITGQYANAATELIKMQIEEQGGILNGRPLKVISEDCEGVVSKASVSAQKLVRTDKVSAMVWGGVTSANGHAVAAVTDPARVFFATLFSDTTLVSDYTYTAYAGSASATSYQRITIKAVQNLFHPATIVYVVMKAPAAQALSKAVKKECEDIGIKTEGYIELDVENLDIAPIATRLRYLSPDLVLYWLPVNNIIALNTSMEAQGGWGDIETFSVYAYGAATQVAQGRGSDGMYTVTGWWDNPGDPAVTAYTTAWKKAFAEGRGAFKAFGPMPDNNVALYYNCLKAVIAAIELAGTDDPEEVAKAALSGKLQFESAMGLATVDTDGSNNLLPKVLRIEGGKFVLVDIQ